jgi:glycosyltransferase involved in cell wall biosynthesis
VDVHVFFAHRQSPKQQGDAGFGVPFEWDSNLLGGYEHTFMLNRSRRPSTESYGGCDSPEIEQRLAGGSFDALLAMGWYLKSYVQAIRASNRLGMGVMVRGDSTLGERRNLLVRAAKRVIFPIAHRQISAFPVVGKQSKLYLEHFGVGQERMFWSPHAVDNEWFAAKAQAATGSRQDTRAALGCLPGESIVLFVGKFVAHKRPGDLVEALATLHTQGAKVRGIFVGDGELDGRLRVIAGQTNAPVSLVGFKNQSELPAIYAAADVLVLPSARETWGLVVNEAMACGTPAIVSNAVGCADDLIETGNTGYRYRVGDIESLSAAIKAMLQIASSDGVNRALREKMHEYSLERAVEGILAAREYGRKHCIVR